MKRNPRQLKEEHSISELARRAQAGQQEAFGALVRYYGPRLYHFIRLKVRGEADAEDLVQETMLKAYANLARYDNRFAFSTWLFTIGRREVVNYYRGRKREEGKRAGREAGVSPDPVMLLTEQEEREQLWRLARHLPERQYDALWLRYVERQSVAEVAEVLGLTRIHVKVLLYRGRTGLAQLHKRASVRERGRREAVLEKVLT